MVDAAGTTKYTYTAGNQLLTEDGPFASDTDEHLHALSIAQPTAKIGNMFCKKKHWRRCLVGILLFLLLALILPNCWIAWTVGDRLFQDFNRLPQNEICLLLGTDKIRAVGGTNFHYTARIDAASKLLKSGKVKTILVSGHRDNRGFDEPVEMKQELLARGIPESAIIIDGDGARTIKSVGRAKTVHNLDRLTVVTDRFHASRAIFLCLQHDIDATAFCAEKEPGWFWPAYYQFREWFARTKAVMDVIKMKFVREKADRK